MGKRETHDYGGPSLDLTNHHYDGPESEMLRFVQFCQDQLGEFSLNGAISSVTFLRILSKYCAHGDMRSAVCQAAEKKAFKDLPIDVQLAFASERCDGGVRGTRIECLDELTKESDFILVPEAWRDEICSTTYPIVNNNILTVSAEEHVLSTHRGTQNSGFGENDSGTTGPTWNIADDHTRRLNIFKQSYSEPTLADTADKRPFGKAHKESSTTNANVFHKAYPEQPPSKEQDQPTLTANVFHKGPGSTIQYLAASLPTTAPSQRKSTSAKGEKGKKDPERLRPSPRPTLIKFSAPTQAPAPSQMLVFPSSRSPTFFPSPSPEYFISDSTSPTPIQDIMGVPTNAPVLIPLGAATSVPTFHTTVSSTPSQTGLYSTSMLDSSLVPFDTRSDHSEGSTNDGATGPHFGTIVGLMVGILIIPFMLLLSAKIYQRQRSRREENRDLLIMEDCSIISEGSAMFKAMGCGFRKSDDLSFKSDIESFDSGGARVCQPKGLVHRIRFAFNKMYEFMEVEDTISIAPEVKAAIPRDEIPDKVKVSDLRRMRQVFHPDQRSMYNEPSTGIMKINPGTMLLPEDMYLQEFEDTMYDTDVPYPVVYQVGQQLTRQVQGYDKQNKGQRPQLTTTTHGTKEAIQTLKQTPPPFNKKLYSDPIPISWSSSESSSQSSAPAEFDKNNTLKVRSPSYNTDDGDDFRIVGLAPESVSDESEYSLPFDEPPLKVTARKRTGKLERPSPALSMTARAQSRPVLTPDTFNKLSSELDVMVEEALSSPPGDDGIHAASPALFTDYNLISMYSMSQLSESTEPSSAFEGLDFGVRNNEPPATRRTQGLRTTYWPNNGYPMDVLGEHSETHYPNPLTKVPNSLATGSWQQELESWGSAKESAASVMSETSQDDTPGIEATISSTGSVALIPTTPTRTKRQVTPTRGQKHIKKAAKANYGLHTEEYEF